ncbi:MAG TPA: VOC family protein [Gemmatimonadales bacterium]|nr:VOC family protein [Gemmatimonadales bacterium]
MTSAVEGLVGQSVGISLTVKDLEKSRHWYVDMLGFKEERRNEREGQLRTIGVGAGDVHLLLNLDDGAKGWTRVKGEGLSFSINTQQNIDDIAKRYRDAGGVFAMEPKDMPWGARVFRVVDPDGFKWSVSKRQG